MAQKKLLSVLILILAFTLNASGKEAFELKEEDMEFANNLARKSRKASLLAIKEKWLELQMLKVNSSNQSVLSNIESLDNPLSRLSANTTLRVFVSDSMGKQLLKNYIEQAKRYKAVLVFNGLPNGSWRELAGLIYEITGGTAENTAVQLDDISFKEYSITSVPSFVLSSQEDVFNQDRAIIYDKVSGNIGIKRALEEISEKGDLSEVAQEILDEARL